MSFGHWSNLDFVNERHLESQKNVLFKFHLVRKVASAADSKIQHDRC